MGIAVTTTTLSADDEAARNAYNCAFSEMEIDWHWDAATYRELLADGGQPVRSFVQRHRPHLLRAYAIDCLVDAVETTRRELSAPRAR
ncbi:MAG: hypothetical protein ACHP83_11365 [Burkholderiales bacterium]|jgi:hypothetical protein